MLEFNESLVKRDSDGALFVRYTPVLDANNSPGCCAVGELRFASWDVSVGEPLEKHEAAKTAARANVVRVLRTLADKIEKN
jgi:hypothetical protein